MHWADKYIARGDGAGWGFREGNKQRGKMIQHTKSAHPELNPGGTA